MHHVLIAPFPGGHLHSGTRRTVVFLMAGYLVSSLAFKAG